jgi:lipoprotein-anchoring transpeptidase ErfK/SrfK
MSRWMQPCDRTVRLPPWKAIPPGAKNTAYGIGSWNSVLMEPGPPGTQRATPRGTFRVQWKAGANYISSEYDEPMPYAVFFAPGGVAFHGGSLTTPSHGCVHLDIGSARYYHDHLPVGAVVVVF